MIILPIILSLVIGLLLLRIGNQHKYLLIIEQIVLGFFIGIILGVFVLFFQGIFGYSFSLIPIYGIGLLLVLYTAYLQYKEGFFNSVYDHITNDLGLLYKNFNGLLTRKKILIVLIGIYSLIKIIMVFSINTSMPTFDEDAVAGWDMKTKVFYNNNSLVLDKSNPEFLGTDLSRYPFVGLIDFYFLMGIDRPDITGLTNLISPLVYLFSIIVLFGIFYRVTNLFYASIVVYAFLSMPFLFIHGIGSYRNFISGFFLFLIVFYTIDQYIDKKNRNIIIAIIPLAILFGVIRNESFLILSIVSFLLVCFEIYSSKKFNSHFIIYLLIAPIIVFLLIQFIKTSYLTGIVMNTGNTELGIGLIQSVIQNVTKPGVFIAPFQQVFYHTDYNLLFLCFVIALLGTLYYNKKISYIFPYIIIILVLLSIFLLTLYGNVEGLGLLSHYSFVRYPLGIIHLLIFVVFYVLYYINKNLSGGK